MASFPVGGLLNLLLEDNPSQVTQEESLVKKKSYREWSDESVHFLLSMLSEKYWESHPKPFKESHWNVFARKMNEQFPVVPERTWKQCRNKYERMRPKYKVEKEKQDATGAAPSKWPWYETFDDMLGGTAKIRGVPGGVDQGTHTTHEETIHLSDEDLDSPPNATSSANTSNTPVSPRSRAAKQPHVSGHINKSAEKRRKEVSVGDQAIAAAIGKFSEGIIQVSKDIIESEKQGRQMLLQGQLQMAALFADALKGKGSSSDLP